MKISKKFPRGAIPLPQLKKYSEFRRKVWLACAKIPVGKTATYSQIAAAIGNPRAARAVGRALAANPFAPAIPCHRVVRADGSSGGYSAGGGSRKKIALLRKEVDSGERLVVSKGKVAAGLPSRRPRRFDGFGA